MKKSLLLELFLNDEDWPERALNLGLSPQAVGSPRLDGTLTRGRGGLERETSEFETRPGVKCFARFADSTEKMKRKSRPGSKKESTPCFRKATPITVDRRDVIPDRVTKIGYRGEMARVQAVGRTGREAVNRGTLT